MPERQLTGTRIRNRRLDRGLRQADVAKSVGISPSYLNLIEHNRRRIGGKLLQDLARALQVEPALLAEGSVAVLLDPLREAAAEVTDTTLTRVEEFAARFPGWAGVVAAQRDRIAMLEERVRQLTDQLSHDAGIATSLHEVLSSAAAIRSTASILAESSDLDADWQHRFHRNVDADSRRLSESLQALIEHLDLSEASGDTLLSPREEAERFLHGSEHLFAGLEDGSATSINLVSSLHNDTVRSIAQSALTLFETDARLLPLSRFEPAALELGHDAFALATRFGVPLSVVLRRLARLSRRDGHPDYALAQGDGDGVVTYLRPVLGFDLPRSGPNCRLWPMDRARAAPGTPLMLTATLPGRSGPERPFDCIAVAEPDGAPRANLPPRLTVTMLLRPVRTGSEQSTL